MLQAQPSFLSNIWNSLQDEIGKLEASDTLVHYGLVVTLPILAVSTWLST